MDTKDEGGANTVPDAHDASVKHAPMMLTPTYFYVKTQFMPLFLNFL